MTEYRRVAVAVAAGLLVAGAVLVLLAFHFRISPNPAPMPDRTFTLAPQVNAKGGGGAPGASSATLTPQPAGLLPAHVYIPSLAIAASYVPEPVINHSLRIPGSVKIVGLSTAGAPLNGSTGTVLLASHVDYVGQGHGVFYRLASIAPAATIWITDATGAATTWTVTGLADPLKPDLDQSIFDATGPRRLVLVTCAGAVHDGSYDRNLIVYAAPVRLTPSGGRP